MPLRRDFLLCGTFIFALTFVSAAEEHKITTSAELGGISASVTTSPSLVNPSFIGLYSADGKYKSLDANPNSLAPTQESVEEWRVRSSIVPHFVSRRNSETVVQDFAPPARPKTAMKAKSGLAGFRDRLINALYGPEPNLLSPTLVTTDSHERLIVSDPSEPAIHILSGTDSFRIQGGRGYRLHHPAGIAVDSRDNIYVSDDELGAILVYAPTGLFLRQLGTSHGERMFQTPTGIAIDRSTDLLYVLDSPMNEIVVLNLEGRTVRRIGGRHQRNTTTTLDVPSGIAVGSGSIVVLDAYNSRIQVLDTDGTFRKSFPLRPVKVSPFTSSVGLALDKNGNIYTNHLEDATVRIYSPTGEHVGTLGSSGPSSAHLASPIGVCSDLDGHIFIADPSTSSIRVFQSTPQTLAQHTERH